MSSYPNTAGVHQKGPRQTWTSGPLILYKMVNFSLGCRIVKTFLLNLGVYNVTNEQDAGLLGS